MTFYIYPHTCSTYQSVHQRTICPLFVWRDSRFIEFYIPHVKKFSVSVSFIWFLQIISLCCFWLHTSPSMLNMQCYLTFQLSVRDTFDNILLKLQWSTPKVGDLKQVDTTILLIVWRADCPRWLVTIPHQSNNIAILSQCFYFIFLRLSVNITIYDGRDLLLGWVVHQEHSDNSATKLVAAENSA